MFFSVNFFHHKLFSLMRLCFFQVPRESLLFVITAFGGVVSWEGDGAPFEESNQDINYQVRLMIIMNFYFDIFLFILSHVGAFVDCGQANSKP